MKKIGVLTGGGDAPGLNAVLRSIYKYGKEKNISLIGFKNGFSGIYQKDYLHFNDEIGSGLLHRGGTILGTNNRDNPFKFKVKTNGVTEYSDISSIIKQHLLELGIECLIAIGGDGTLSIARDLHQIGVPVVGVPKTIDNDLETTERTFGFDTAVQTVTDALDKLHTTAESHHRVMVIEVMGRYAGWIALYSGLAGGADIILIPERNWSFDGLYDKIQSRKQIGKHFSIIVVAEGASLPEHGYIIQKQEEGRSDPIRLGGIGQYLANRIEGETQMEARSLVLGHLQRGGTPVANDRLLATRYGIHALDLALKKEYGTVTSLQNGKIVAASLSEATSKLKMISPTDDLLEICEKMGIYIGEVAGLG